VVERGNLIQYLENTGLPHLRAVTVSWPPLSGRYFFLCIEILLRASVAQVFFFSVHTRVI